MTANILSFARMLLVLPLLSSLHHDGESISFTTLSLLALGALSDLADGYFARRYNQVSRLGRVLDPLADKLFLGALGVGLYLWHGFPAWLVAAILFRDAVIVLVGLFLLWVHDVVIRPNYFGKYTTVCLILVGLAYLINLGAPLRGGLGALAGVMLVVSSVSYAIVLRSTLLDLGRPTTVTETSECRSA
jgi:cardiolipin synthase (CMP-forming)